MNIVINSWRIIKSFLLKFKKPLIWIVLTLLIYILLATAVMFSRQTTLHGVRAFDFKIFNNSIKLFEPEHLHKDFKTIADTLTLNKGKTIFFPVAILDKNGCTENGNRNDKLCNKFMNINAFNQLKNGIPARYRNFDKKKELPIYDLKDGESYLYQNIGNDSILIGQAGKYLINSNIKALYIFMKDDWSRFFITKDKHGNYGNILKTWQKTNGIFLIISITSLLLYLFFIWYFKAKERDYENLKNKSMQTDSLLYKLNQEFNDLSRQKKTIENQIAELSRNNDLSAQNSDITKKQMAEFKANEQKIRALILEKKHEIISIEHIDSNIIDDIKHKSEKISSTNMAKEIEMLIDKLHDIKRLWQRELTWTERKELESSITGYETKIPFTISQSVILFEKEIVLKKAKMCKGYDQQMNLFEMIELISKDETKEIKGILHKIRKARNDWSHKGIAPSKEVLNDLLRLLNHFKVEPAF